ncbi:MAG: ATP-binding cassette domain-containing protein [Sphingobacteriales bacterium]|nr:ATP-binding cassette domain-containing protein [Sphingobacteriales bacterium]
MIFLVLSSMTALAFPAIIGTLLDTAVGKQAGNFLSRYWSGLGNASLLTVSKILFLVLVLQAFFSFCKVISFSFVSENVMADIRKDLFSKVLTLPFSFFEKNRVGDLTSRLTADITQLQDAISWTLGEFFRQLFTLVIGIGFLLLLSPKLCLVMLSTFPALIIGAVIFGKYIKKLSKKTQESLAEANVIAEETLQNMSVVKSFTNEHYESNRYNSFLKNVVNFALRSSLFYGLFTSFFIFGIFGGIILVLWFGASYIEQGLMSTGELTTFVIYTIYIGASLGGMSDLYSRLQKAVGASERVREILGENSEVALQKITPAQIPVRGNITYQDVHFHYPSRPDIEVLKGLTLHIQAGEKVALVGKSGAGKSTITQLLQRFYDWQTGSILLDGKDIRNYEMSLYRSNIGVVPQEILLFGGTIRENIAYGNLDADDAAIMEAARRANALSFIQSFPEGLDTIVGERGIKLSGGQRQRIAIARALLRNPRILILDEATSSLDSESEKLVQEALNELMKGRTSIIIAHRLSTIREVDKIFVLEDGEIVEQGTHEELSNMPNGKFRALLELQQTSSAVFTEEVL